MNNGMLDISSVPTADARMLAQLYSSPRCASIILRPGTGSPKRQGSISGAFRRGEARHVQGGRSLGIEEGTVCPNTFRYGDRGQPLPVSCRPFADQSSRVITPTKQIPCLLHQKHYPRQPSETWKDARAAMVSFSRSLLLFPWIGGGSACIRSPEWLEQGFTAANRIASTTRQ